MLKANYEDSRFVRKVSIVNQYKILTVLLMPTIINEQNSTEIFSIYSLAEDAEDPGRSETEYNMLFTIELNSLNATVAANVTRPMTISESVSKAIVSTTPISVIKKFKPYVNGSQMDPRVYNYNDPDTKVSNNILNDHLRCAKFKTSITTFVFKDIFNIYYYHGYEYCIFTSLTLLELNS